MRRRPPSPPSVAVARCLPGLAPLVRPSAEPDAATLAEWASLLALRHFGERFPGSVRWAPRLRHRAGDFTPATCRIRLSLPYYRRYGAGEAEAILLHELCHWWLYRNGVQHREDAPAFQALLRAVGAPRRARPMARPRPERRYVYACPRCGLRYAYTRRVGYACGRCCRSLGRFDPRFRLRLVEVRPPRRLPAPRGPRQP